MKSKKYIGKALKAAYKGQHDQHQHGSILVKDNKILAIGFNKRKSHPLMGPIKHIHSEVDTIIQCNSKRIDIPGSILFNGRVTKTGIIGMSKPCSICEMVLRNAGVVKVFYTDSEGNIKEMWL